MKIQKVIRLSNANKMLKSPLYRSAHQGSFEAAYALIDSLNIDFRRFENFSGFVCPVQKIKGNQIPVALACKIMEHSKAHMCSDIYLTNNRPGNEMALRIMYQPCFTGTSLPGRFIIVDDIFTTGNTLLYLKNFIEKTPDATVIKAVVLGTSKAGPFFEPNKAELRLLLAKFPDIDRYFTLEAMTAGQVKYLLRFNSLQGFYMNFFEKSLHLQTP